MKSEHLTYQGDPIGKIIEVAQSQFRFEPLSENELAFFGVEDHLFHDRDELKAAVFSRLRMAAA